MRFENTQVSGFEAAFRGARNPKNSWNLSDSYFGLVDIDKDIPETEIADKWVQFSHPELDWPNVFTDEGCTLTDDYADKLCKNGTLRFDRKNEIIDAAYIGPKDMKLAQTLIKAGPEHRKFLRQIFVSVDITAPLYIWKELDTYKIATVANSQSTMHKLDSKPITLDCFEIDDFEPNLKYYSTNTTGMLSEVIIEQLEYLRQKYVETKDKRYWKELVRWLPEGWLQTRTWTANYETIRAICSPGQRRFHKLNEWGGVDNNNVSTFIKWARNLPYAQYLIFDDENIPFQIEK